MNVYPGGSLPFSLNVYEYEGGPLYDADDITFSIYQGNLLIHGPQILPDIEHVGEGIYSYTWTAPVTLIPGTYEARWTATVNGSPISLAESFKILLDPGSPSTLLSAPRLKGEMRESPLYKIMGSGLTDSLFLVGHADGLPINDPYQVASVQEAVNLLQANANSSLLRGLLEAYYAGARDIWLVAAAPTSEFDADHATRNDPKVDLGDKTFYQLYYERLEETYRVLEDWDIANVVVPLEASIHGTGGYDFVTQLVEFCENTYNKTGNPTLGIIGMRGTLNEEVAVELLEDVRFSVQGDGGKFVIAVAGEVLFDLKELPTTYSGSPAAPLAGLMSTMRLDRGLTYTKVPNLIRPAFPDLSPALIQALAEHQVNCITQTTAGRRGVPFQVSIATDNTLGTAGTDYWSLVQMRLVTKVMSRIRNYGKRDIGNLGFAMFRTDVQQYLLSLSQANAIKDFELNVYRSETESGKVHCDVKLRPYFGLRDISFSTVVGPGE